MNSDRRTILWLTAMGRITPHEAERLLAMGPDSDEAILRVAVGFAIAWLALPELHEIAAGLAHTIHSLTPGLFAAGHHALAIITRLLGGGL
ncbi:MAG TPA: hypothetical protein VMU48_06665 [Terracidiphilus sp.]|nr:hypothetical protein [Terracidiphilus sp.]